MQTIRVFESFAGYGSQLMALRRLEQAFPDQIKVVPVGISEIDAHAIKAYHAVHGEDVKNYGDISKIDWAQVPDFDLFTYSSPCFVAGTLVNTKRGMIPIEEVKVGDMVLTHKNRYQKVLRVGHKPSSDLYEIKGMAFDKIVCTGNHPFYARESHLRYGSYGVRLFGEPQWTEAKDLGEGAYCAVAINKRRTLPKWRGLTKELMSNPAFWYLMGVYVASGCTTLAKSGGTVSICCGIAAHSDGEKKLRDAIAQCGFTASVYGDDWKHYVIRSKPLFGFVQRYGKYAHGKVVDAETLALPAVLLKAFVEGVIDRRQTRRHGDRRKIDTASRVLAYGMAQCVAKVYNLAYSVNFSKRGGNKNNRYCLVYQVEECKFSRAFTEDGTIWFPIQKVERLDGQTATVYNLEVENDNSYTANGVVVHNCQDFSSAGLQRGGEKGSGTRSSLLWECERAIAEKRPKWLLMENVAALVSGKFIKLFNKWQRTLESYGYRNFAKVLNAKDYGVPQNRERIFVVSILDEAARYYFPQPIPLKKRLKDVLEPVVDECYYINDIQVQKVLNSSFAQERGRLQTAIAGEARARDWKDPKLVCVGALSGGVWDARNESTKRVYDPDGIAPTQNCCEGGGLQTKIVEPTAIQQCGDYGNGYYKEKDVAFTLMANPMSDRQQYIKEPTETK